MRSRNRVEDITYLFLSKTFGRKNSLQDDRILPLARTEWQVVGHLVRIHPFMVFRLCEGLHEAIQRCVH
ncbi:MAG: hypothetical protein RR280_10530, partial [Bacteroidaceae bacterium]